jgi:ParB family chromosome partitioning protein
VKEYICEVSLDEIRVSPFQPRREMKESDLNELAESIKAIGLIHPPVVRTIESNGKILYYELIAGERRWRASRKAGLEKINVLVRSSSDSEAAKATLIENVQRIDLNPIDTAEGLKRLIEVFQMTQEEVADKVGKKRSTVANYLRLLTLSEEMRSSIVRGEISMGHAKAILSLDSPELKERLHHLVVEMQLNVRDTEKESQKLARLNQKKRGNSKQSTIVVADLEEKLVQKFGTKITIEHQKNSSGSVRFRYYNLDDLDRLLSLLGVSENSC